MDIRLLSRRAHCEWEIARRGDMLVPVIIHATEALVREMDDQVREQAVGVAGLPGIVLACHVMPDAHWDYGFPIGSVAAFDAQRGGVVVPSAMGFDVSCGVRCLHTGLVRDDIMPFQHRLADTLFARIPVGPGSRASLRLNDNLMHDMLTGGARWAVEHDWGTLADLERIEGHGQVKEAQPGCVSDAAKVRQSTEMGTLGDGNHYLEVQEVVAIHDVAIADAYGLKRGDVVVALHCGSRSLSYQVGIDYLRLMAQAAPAVRRGMPDSELACTPLKSELGQRYLGAMRAAANCALANRQILTHLVRQVFGRLISRARMPLLYDVSHNTCREEEHRVDGDLRHVFVHRRGATQALGPGHPGLPEPLRQSGQPVMVGGALGEPSYVLAGMNQPDALAFSSACHGAGRAISRRSTRRHSRGAETVEALAARGIIVRGPSGRSLVEEAPGDYKNMRAVVDAAEIAGLARKVARLEPLICVKG